MQLSAATYERLTLDLSPNSPLRVCVDSCRGVVSVPAPMPSDKSTGDDVDCKGDDEGVTDAGASGELKQRRGHVFEKQQVTMETIFISLRAVAADSSDTLPPV